MNCIFSLTILFRIFNNQFHYLYNLASPIFLRVLLLQRITIVRRCTNIYTQSGFENLKGYVKIKIPIPNHSRVHTVHYCADLFKLSL